MSFKEDFYDYDDYYYYYYTIRDMSLFLIYQFINHQVSIINYHACVNYY